MKKTPPSPTTVYLVGSGPGDPGLLTLRARELLAKAEIVLYDHLVNPEILKFCPQAKLDYVGKIGHGHSISQEKILERIRRASRKYRIILRLKGGDPFIFGRGGEEAEALAEAGIRFEVVPGVSSAIAVPAYAGIPLTHRRHASELRILTGHEACTPSRGGKRSSSLHHPQETLILLMAVQNLGSNLERLAREGIPASTPAAIVEWGTYPRQRSLVGTLGDLAAKAEAARIESPAVVLVGEVVRLREKLNWLEERPLFGKKILVTRPLAQAEALNRPLRELGAEVLELPSFAVEPLRDLRRLDQALRRISGYDWLVFTSVNTVDLFFERMKRLGLDIRSLRGVKIASVGPATSQALSERMLTVDREAKALSSDSLAASLKTREIRGKKILFPRAEIARANIVEDLRSRGAKLEVVPIYRAKPLRYPAKLLKENFDPLPHLLTFTSSLGVRYFFEGLRRPALKERILKIPCAVLGPETKATAEALGFRVVAMPAQSTVPYLVEEILGFLSAGFDALHSQKI